MNNKIDIKSLAFGLVLGAIILFSLGATTSQPFVKEIAPVRFRVLDVSTPQVTWRHGGQVVVLKLQRFYGKIERDSHDWRLKNETQELTLATIVDAGYEIRKDDIIDFQASGHLKSSER